jgi:hypothetical protein
MANWVSNGGCMNGGRIALDGAGDGSRNWLTAADTAGAIANTGQVIIFSIAMDGDDMNAITGDFVLEWYNDDDGGSWSDLASTGELKWATVSDLTNGGSVTEAEGNGTENCSTMGVTWANGLEREGANAATLTSISSKALIEIQWAIDLSGADGANQDTYSFRVSESGGGTGVYKTYTSTIQVEVEGTITGTTKKSNRSSAIGGVTVTAYLSDEAGTDPKPTGAHVAQVVSHASTGVYALLGLASGADYFLHFYKDDTNDVSDGSPPVTAVDV